MLFVGVCGIYNRDIIMIRSIFIGTVGQLLNIFQIVLSVKIVRIFNKSKFIRCSRAQKSYRLQKTEELHTPWRISFTKDATDCHWVTLQFDLKFHLKWHYQTFNGLTARRSWVLSAF